MDMSVFDLFKIGIGPSSSHTVGPMVAARRFLLECGPLDAAVGVAVHLYGSLALTGVGHATDKAVLLGLMGETPQGVDPDTVDDRLAEVDLDGVLPLLGVRPVPFARNTDLVWHMGATLPGHPNGLRFVLSLDDGSIVERIYYSIGGGFIVSAAELSNPPKEGGAAHVPYDFDTMAALLAHGERTGLSIPAMLRANECARMPDADLDAGLDRIWATMRTCIDHGLATEGELPGVSRSGAAPRGCGARSASRRAGRITCRTTPSTASACTRWPSTKKTRRAGVS
jgi:L-serine dehydratase